MHEHTTVRFGATAAVTPQKILCGIERLSPAIKVVEAAAAPSRHPVMCKRRTARWTTNSEFETDNVADKVKPIIN